MSVKSKAKDQRTILERLIASVPGFGGYYERDSRRAADAIQRRFTADRLDEIRTRIRRHIADVKDPKFLQAWGKVEQTLIRLAQKIRFAEYGYSGFFDSVKIRETELDTLYEVDGQILDRVMSLSESISPSSEAGSLLDLLYDLEETFDRRKTLIEEVR